MKILKKNETFKEKWNFEENKTLKKNENFEQKWKLQIQKKNENYKYKKMKILMKHEKF